MTMPNVDEMREMLRVNVTYNLGLISPEAAKERPAHAAKLVARKLCTHAHLKTTSLVQGLYGIRCEDCGASAVHMEKS